MNGLHSDSVFSEDLDSLMSDIGMHYLMTVKDQYILHCPLGPVDVHNVEIAGLVVDLVGHRHCLSSCCLLHIVCILVDLHSLCNSDLQQFI